VTLSTAAAKVRDEHVSIAEAHLGDAVRDAT
jgi:hypothetical protein